MSTHFSSHQSGPDPQHPKALDDFSWLMPELSFSQAPAAHCEKQDVAYGQYAQLDRNINYPYEPIKSQAFADSNHCLLPTYDAHLCNSTGPRPNHHEPQVLEPSQQNTVQLGFSIANTGFNYSHTTLKPQVLAPRKTPTAIGSRSARDRKHRASEENANSTKYPIQPRSANANVSPIRSKDLLAYREHNRAVDSSWSFSSEKHMSGISASNPESSVREVEPRYEDEADSRVLAVSAVAKARRAGKDRKVPLYACPFYKRDPALYENNKGCSGTGWPAVHRVREHIVRNHKLPITCSRCSEVFVNSQLRDEHTRAEIPCQLRTIHREGCSEEQKALLRSRTATQGKSEDERWVRMYKILFPNEEDVPDPYFESRSSLCRRMLHNFKDHVLSELPKKIEQDISSSLSCPGCRTSNSNIRGTIAQCVEELLEDFVNLQPYLALQEKPPPYSPTTMGEVLLSSNSSVTGSEIERKAGSSIKKLPGNPTKRPAEHKFSQSPISSGSTTKRPREGSQWN